MCALSNHRLYCDTFLLTVFGEVEVFLHLEPAPCSASTCPTDILPPALFGKLCSIVTSNINKNQILHQVFRIHSNPPHLIVSSLFGASRTISLRQIINRPHQLPLDSRRIQFACFYSQVDVSNIKFQTKNSPSSDSTTVLSFHALSVINNHLTHL